MAAEFVLPYKTGAGMKVAVIDTGIDLDHEEEILIDVGPGFWHIVAKSERKRRSIKYSIEGALSYEIQKANVSVPPFMEIYV